MTIQIPDELARGLESMAAAQKKSVEEFAIERLKLLFEEVTAPSALLRVLKALPHPSAAAVDDLEAAIASGRLPVRDEGMFDRSPAE
jgi:hypothetical protein